MTGMSPEEVDELSVMIGSATDGFLNAAHSLARLRRLRVGDEGFDRSTWQLMAEAGWLAIRLPEDSGGAGLPPRIAAEMAHRFGAALLPEPFIACGVMPSLLLAGCDRPEQLAAFVSGEHLVTVAWQEASGQLSPGVPATTLRHGDGGLRLDGRKLWVPAGATADLLLVHAITESGAQAIVAIPRDRTGTTITEHNRREGCRFASIDFADVAVEADDVFVEGEAAVAALTDAIVEGTVLLGAYLCGIASRLIEMTAAYVATRQQFGQPIGAFQTMQHKIADMAIASRLAQATVDIAAAQLARGGDDAVRLSSAAKASSAAAAMHVARKAIQAHGAIGYTEEADVGLYLNAVVRLAPWLGGERQHSQRFAALELSLETVDA